jgi:mannose-1-phosphate guanylyltransferase
MLKALILVGGYGTRLRPLTFTKPKPLVEFCNKSILVHQIEALVKVGVHEIILAINYQPEVMMEFLSDIEKTLDVRIICSQETEPLGTAGPLALAREHLSTADYFFVFNSDVTCEYPLGDLLAFHKRHGKEGTIMVTKVSEPSKYGVVIHDAAGQIQHFVEKPQTFVGNHINAGLYCFSRSILDRIELKPTSIEKEVFPQMTSAGELYAMVLPGYWMDIGQPHDYLIGMCLHLESIRAHNPAALASGPGIIGDVLIDPTATIGEGCVIGPNVVIGPGCVVESGVRIVRSTLLANVRAESHCMIKSSIVGWKSTIGKWAHVDAQSVLGENVQIDQELCILGAIILPHKGIKSSIHSPGTIVM